MKVLILIIWIVTSTLLFGSPYGLTGNVVNFLSPAFKTKAILTLAIFGTMAVAVSIYDFIFPTNKSREEGLIIALMCMFASWSFASAFQDCAVFNFCE
jgi:hypothetical protein